MKNIEKGDLVKCTYDFTIERKQFRYNYPEVGQLLVVNKIMINEFQDRCLKFDELDIPIPLCEACFELVQDEYEADSILNEAFKIANRLH